MARNIKFSLQAARKNNKTNTQTVLSNDEENYSYELVLCCESKHMTSVALNYSVLIQHSSLDRLVSGLHPP